MVHSSCESFILMEQNAMLCYANGVSVLIFVVFMLHCYNHALKAPHMNSLPFALQLPCLLNRKSKITESKEEGK